MIRAARAAIAAAALVAAVAATAAAQGERAAPADSTPPRDSLSRAAMQPQGPNHGGMYLLFGGLAVAMTALVVAPSAWLLVPWGPPPLSPPEVDPVLNRGSFQVGIAAMGDTAQNGGYSASYEMLRGGQYLELRVATWRLPEQFQYQSLRVGRFWHPTPRLAGGIIVGYQHTPQLRTQSGPEIALPLVVLGKRAEARFENSYVITPERVQLNYRFRMDWRLGRGPLRAGLDFELKQIREPTPFTGGLSMMLSVRP